MREAKLALLMSEKASLIDASLDNQIRNELYQQEIKEMEIKTKEIENEWYLMNKQALTEYHENEVKNQLDSLEFDRINAEKAKQVEELNKMEMKEEEQDLRESRRMDMESIKNKADIEKSLNGSDCNHAHFFE